MVSVMVGGEGDGECDGVWGWQWCVGWWAVRVMVRVMVGSEGDGVWGGGGDDGVRLW